MPVMLPLPNASLTSYLPSLFASRSATAPPPVGGVPRPPVVCSATYRSPLGATVMCRAGPRFSATTSAQNPAGSLMPPLSGSHAGDCVLTETDSTAAAPIVAAAAAKRFVKETIGHLFLFKVQSSGLQAQGSGLRAQSRPK